jgi:Transcription factor S-II (TFIIS)
LAIPKDTELLLQIRSADEPETVVKSCLKCGTVGDLCTKYCENNYAGIKDVPTLARDHNFIGAQAYKDYKLIRRRAELSSVCEPKDTGKGSRSLQSLVIKRSSTNAYLPESSTIKFESCLVLKCAAPLYESESKDLTTGNKGLKCVVNFKLEVLRVIWISSEMGAHGTSTSVSKEGVVIVSKDFRLFVLGDLNYEVKTLSDCRVGLQLECVGSISRVVSTEDVVCDYWCDTESVRIKCHNVNLHVGSYLELRNHPSVVHPDFRFPNTHARRYAASRHHSVDC